VNPLRQFSWLVRRTAYEIYQRTHPTEPWIAQGAVRYLDHELTRNMTGLEWGSGRSTQWFARRLGRLVSIEFNETWYQTVSKQIQGIPNVRILQIPIEPDLPVQVHYDVLPRYVAAINEFAEASIDFVLVDGHYRQACVLAALTKLRPGGLLAIDNTDWIPLPEWGVPHHWPIEHQSRNVLTQTTVWRKPQ
jgi:hypothetical protein